MDHARTAILFNWTNDNDGVECGMQMTGWWLRRRIFPYLGRWGSPSWEVGVLLHLGRWSVFLQRVLLCFGRWGPSPSWKVGVLCLGRWRSFLVLGSDKVLCLGRRELSSRVSFVLDGGGPSLSWKVGDLSLPWEVTEVLCLGWWGVLCLGRWGSYRKVAT